MDNRKKILIAYDASECADEMLVDLRRAGLPPVADVRVLYVEEVWLPIPAVFQNGTALKDVVLTAAAGSLRQTGELSGLNLSEAQIKTTAAVRRLADFFPEWTIEAKFTRGSPAAAVIHKAEEFGADLIITGAHGRSGFNHLWIGSVSQKVANEAACSVRVARGHGNWKNGSPVRILIGLDGTDASFAAVEEVANRFWTNGSETRLVVAIDRADSLFDSRKLIDGNGKAAAASDVSVTPIAWVANFVERARRRLSRGDLQISEIIEEGDPKQIIIAEAEEWGADCIFIGAGADDKPGNPARFLLGSVSTAVLSRAHCSVEIIRRHKRNV